MALVRQMVLLKDEFYPAILRQPFFQTSNSLGFNQCKAIKRTLGKIIKDDENNVQDCNNMIKEWGVPFKKSKTPTGLLPQIQGQENVIKDMLYAESTGKGQKLEFRFYSAHRDKLIDFHATVKQSKLHAFESAINVGKTKVNGNEVAVRSDRDTFARLLSLTKSFTG